MAERKLQIIIEETLKGTGAKDAAKNLEATEKAALDAKLELSKVEGQAKALRAAMGNVAVELASGNKLTNEAEQEYRELAVALDKVEAESRQLKDAQRSVNDDMERTGSVTSSTTSKMVTAIGGIAAAWGLAEAAQVTYGAAIEGAAILGQQSEFENLAESIGATADVLEDRLGEATAGMLSDAQIVASASEIISLGLADSEQGVVRLTNAAARLGLDMQVLGLTLANDSTARLDSLGLSMQRVGDIADELSASGFVGDAFDEAVIIALEERMELLGDSSQSTAGKIQAFQADIANLTDTFKVALAEGIAPMVDELSEADIEEFASDLTAVAQLMAGIVRIAGKEVSRTTRIYADAREEWRGWGEALTSSSPIKQLEQDVVEAARGFEDFEEGLHAAGMAITVAKSNVESFEEQSQRLIVAQQLVAEGFTSDDPLVWAMAIGQATSNTSRFTDVSIANEAALKNQAASMQDAVIDAGLLSEAERDLYDELLKSTGAIDENRLAIIDANLANIDNRDTLNQLLGEYGQLTPEVVSHINRIVELESELEGLNAANSDNIPVMNALSGEIEMQRARLAELIAAIQTGGNAYATSIGAIDGWAASTRQAGNEAEIALAKYQQLAATIGVANAVNRDVQMGLARAGIQTQAEFAELSDALDAWSGGVSGVAEETASDVVRSFGRATREVEVDYDHLADEIENAAERITEIEEKRAERITEIEEKRAERITEIEEKRAERTEAINERSAEREDAIRDRMGDAWEDYYSRRENAEAQFIQKQSREFLSLLDKIENDSAPDFDELIGGYAEAEAAAGSAAGELRELLEGFKDTDDLAEAEKIQSFTDAMQSLAESDLETEEKRAAIQALQEQFAEGETANLESFGVQILTANELAERATRDRLAEVEGMEREATAQIAELHSDSAKQIAELHSDSAKQIAELHSDSAKQIEAAHSTASEKIEDVIKRLGGNLENELGRGESAAAGVRDRLGEVQSLASELDGTAIDIIVNYVESERPTVSAEPVRPVNGAGGAGFSDGGYTGMGAINEIAGIVHRDELVIPSRVRRAGIDAMLAFIEENDPLGQSIFSRDTSRGAESHTQSADIKIRHLVEDAPSLAKFSSESRHELEKLYSESAETSAVSISEQERIEATESRIATIERLEERSNELVRSLHRETAEELSDLNEDFNISFVGIADGLIDLSALFLEQFGQTAGAAASVRDNLQQVQDYIAALDGSRVVITVDYEEGPRPEPLGGGTISNGNAAANEYLIGGYTGMGATGDVAGIVHRDELVIPSSTRHAGLDAMLGFIRDNDPLVGPSLGNNADMMPISDIVAATPHVADSALFRTDAIAPPAMGNGMQMAHTGQQGGIGGSVTINVTQKISGRGASQNASRQIEMLKRQAGYRHMGIRE